MVQIPGEKGSGLDQRLIVIGGMGGDEAAHARVFAHQKEQGVTVWGRKADMGKPRTKHACQEIFKDGHWKIVVAGESNFYVPHICSI